MEISGVGENRDSEKRWQPGAGGESGEKEGTVGWRLAAEPTGCVRVTGSQEPLTDNSTASFNFKSRKRPATALFQFKCVTRRHYVHIILIGEVLCKEELKESRFLFFCSWVFKSIFSCCPFSSARSCLEPQVDGNVPGSELSCKE